MAQDLTINKSRRIKRSHSRVSCSFSLYNVFCFNDQSCYSRKGMQKINWHLKFIRFIKLQMMTINYKHSPLSMFQSYVEKFDKIQTSRLSLYCGIQNLNFNINDLRDYLLCSAKTCSRFRTSICSTVYRGDGGRGAHRF